MAYTLDDFPFETDQPQIDVILPVGTHVLELVVEDSAGLRSLPDTVVVTVEREELPDAVITGIDPVTGYQGRTVSARISGTGLADADGVTFYTQQTVTRPTRPTLPTRTLPTLPTLPDLPTRLNIPDRTVTAVITDRSDEGLRIDISIDAAAATGVRTFSVTTPSGVVHSRDITFTVRGLITPTITIPTITRPTVTIPTITRPTATIPTITRPTVTIPTVTIPTITRPTVTIPTATIPTISRPTATIPTVTIPTITRPTVTRPTVTIPTVTRPVTGGGLTLTSVRGVGATLSDRLTAGGITTVADLAGADAARVARILGYQDVSRARVLIDNARELLG
ncbi:hypothetical protein JCM14469_16140 [Desulfatiferula olefinivorans]